MDFGLFSIGHRGRNGGIGVVAGRGERVGRIQGQVLGGRHLLRGMADNIGKLYCKVEGIEGSGIGLVNRSRPENIKF